MPDSVNPRNRSDELFEQYLAERGFSDVQREPVIAGCPKRPDYRVTVAGVDGFFEVKQFVGPVLTPAGAFDPYAPIREKIGQAHEQLHPLKGGVCAIVLADPLGAQVELQPEVVMGAMLGNLGIAIPLDRRTAKIDRSRAYEAFLSGGKMVRHKDGRPVAPQNTTISALCVLNGLHEGMRRFMIQSALKERAAGRDITFEIVRELLGDRHAAEGKLGVRQLRMIVLDNPYAIAPMPAEFGVGPFDERFAIRGGGLVRVFAGERLMALEDEEREAGVSSSAVPDSLY